MPLGSVDSLFTMSVFEADRANQTRIGNSNRPTANQHCTHSTALVSIPSSNALPAMFATAQTELVRHVTPRRSFCLQVQVRPAMELGGTVTPGDQHLTESWCKARYHWNFKQMLDTDCESVLRAFSSLELLVIVAFSLLGSDRSHRSGGHKPNVRLPAMPQRVSKERKRRCNAHQPEEVPSVQTGKPVELPTTAILNAGEALQEL